MRIRFCVFLCSSILGIAQAQLVGAVGIHKWVDDKGVTHFSQWAPRHTQSEYSEIATTNPPDYDPENYYFSVRNQNARGFVRHEAFEERRATRHALREEQRLTELEQAERYAEPEEVYYPAYFAPRHRLGFFGVHHNKIPRQRVWEEDPVSTSVGRPRPTTKPTGSGRSTSRFSGIAQTRIVAPPGPATQSETLLVTGDGAILGPVP